MKFLKRLYWQFIAHLSAQVAKDIVEYQEKQKWIKMHKQQILRENAIKAFTGEI